jgi:hypothetical protein
MTQQQLEQEVAEATGESLRTIRRRGFSLVNLADVNFDPEPNILPSQYIDWDELHMERHRHAA